MTVGLTVVTGQWPKRNHYYTCSHIIRVTYSYSTSLQAYQDTIAFYYTPLTQPLQAKQAKFSSILNGWQQPYGMLAYLCMLLDLL